MLIVLGCNVDIALLAESEIFRHPRVLIRLFVQTYILYLK